jgi:tetratricopeptide (TPR) repeat protein
LKHRKLKSANADRTTGSGLSRAEWNRRIEDLPPAAKNLVFAAAGAIEKRNPGEARRALIGASAMAPEHAEVLRLQGVLHHLEDRHAEAVSLLRRALARSPEDPLILNNLGSSLRAQGEIEDALRAFERACELQPRLAAAWFNLGKTLKAQARIADARRALMRCLELSPAHVGARMVLGDVLKTMGEIDEAAQAYREVLRRDQRRAQAWFSIANLKTVPFSATEMVQLTTLAADSAFSDEDRVALGFAEVKALEDQGHYSRAYDALRRANALKRRSLVWDAPAFSAWVDRVASAFQSPPPFQADAQQGSEVIFVVSLPRSGSTLVEQILASHSTVEGASELPDLPAVIAEESNRRRVAFPGWVIEATTDDWNRLGRDYLRRTERWREIRPRFTDKGLFNWQYVGAVLAMLPAARIVVCRRDPVETCFSCFHQLFARGQEFSYDLEEVAAYWHDFDRLSSLWAERFPDRVFTLSYEDLLSAPHRSIADLLDFCGLPFEESCLRFHESEREVRTASAAQVRQPLNRDRVRSLKYRGQLASLRRLLDLE